MPDSVSTMSCTHSSFQENSTVQCPCLSPPWLKFIPRCFILFDEVVNEIFFLISHSDSLWLLYKHATDFCMVILYPKILLNLFILFCANS